MHGHTNHESHGGGMHYKHLAIMTLLSFLAMYILMYAMVDRLENVYHSFNQVYMAALMASPMVLIELIIMKMMYPEKKKNMVILAVSTVALIVFFSFIRFQIGISDKQFLRSMIPHHAGAVLMCNEAKISDEEIKSLCNSIIEGQQKEIDKMKAILNRL